MSGKSVSLRRLLMCMLFALLCVSLIEGISARLVTGETEDARRLVPHLGAHRALDLFKSGQIVLLDVHPGQGKVRSQIVGAFYIPADKLDQFKLNIPEKMLVGVFCD